MADKDIRAAATGTGEDEPQITVDAFNEFIYGEMDIARYFGLKLEEIGRGSAKVRLPRRKELLRLGGSINGPAIMAMADFAMYAVVMSLFEDGAKAVTSSMHTHFLRGAFGGDLIALGRVIKAGRRLVICEVNVFAEGEEEPVAHITGAYARTGS